MKRENEVLRAGLAATTAAESSGTTREAGWFDREHRAMLSAKAAPVNEFRKQNATVRDNVRHIRYNGVFHTSEVPLEFYAIYAQATKQRILFFHIDSSRSLPAKMGTWGIPRFESKTWQMH